VESVYTRGSKPLAFGLRVRVPPLLPFLQKEIKMRNIVMLTAALMMGCGDKDEDTGSDTAETQDTGGEDTAVEE
jgi:hypothetical protein